MNEFNQIQKFRADIVNESIQLSKIQNELMRTSFQKTLPSRVQKFMLSRLDSVSEILTEVTAKIDTLNSLIESGDFEGQKKILEEINK